MNAYNQIFTIKLFAMTMSLRNWKRSQDRSHSHKYLSFDEKMVKIGPVDPELIVLKFKK